MDGDTERKPEGLLPKHIGGELKSVNQAAPLSPLLPPKEPGQLDAYLKSRATETFDLRRERYEKRREALDNAPDLEVVLLDSRGKKIRCGCG